MVGKANFDFTLTQLTGQGGSDFYPSEQRRTLQYADADKFLADCGLLASLVSTLIVRRESWLSALAELGGTPYADTTIFPHLPIIATMARHDSRWVWCPAKLVRVRMGNAYLARDEGWNTDQIHARLLADLSRMWAGHLGRMNRVRFTLLRRIYRTFLAPEVLRATAPDGRSLRRRAALMRAYLPIFWWLPEFWLRTVPVLAFGGQTKPTREAAGSTYALPIEQRVARSG